jgi:hypothetical protein
LGLASFDYVIDQTDGINVYVLSTDHTFEMCANDKVLLYVMSSGSTPHVFHMHGNGVKQYATFINDGVCKTFVIDTMGTGMWQVIRHVDDHLS